ncbi:glycine cleavage system protein GcvH [Peribacillus sp. SIMBA_075]|uniref:Glycine cleavage system H protein n=1 Tax=Peribacillus simplex TaxID=1478 RepID=A0AAW7IH13_9BACI|nr:glycine cleavage system protein GcvH [Peribacillus simplex]AMM93125.1 glycine cleavage system protein H [Peribacillus simplex]MDM5453704.1 glycine cleavage system protein GcvH [Peribacillus simplex]
MTKVISIFRYSKEHEWVQQLEGNRVRIGITDYAQKALGDIVFVENPAIDDEVAVNESMGTIESVKAVSELYSPVSGTVVTVNEELEGAPETINEHPFEAGWLVEVEMSNPEELDSLLNEDEYQAFTNEGEE